MRGETTNVLSFSLFQHSTYSGVLNAETYRCSFDSMQEIEPKVKGGYFFTSVHFFALLYISENAVAFYI